MFKDYLANNKADKQTQHTHTRIGNKDMNIFGGKYAFQDNDEFMNLYYKHVIENGNKEYLTEKQLIENSPILIDIDLRYKLDVKTRQHTQDHILDAVMIYMEGCSNLLNIANETSVNVYIMEKPNVNITDKITKDGIHIIIGLSVHRAVQMHLRENVLPRLEEIWNDLPITNSYEDVLDSGITKGHVNWQMYGSQKPNNEAYCVTSHYNITYDDGYWMPELQEDFNLEKNFKYLSARYKEHPAFPLIDKSLLEWSPYMNNRVRDLSKKRKLDVNDGFDTLPENEGQLKKMVDAVINEKPQLQEVHDYTMKLPKQYYETGSYNNWVKVGMALANTDKKLFFLWVLFSARKNCRDHLRGCDNKFDFAYVYGMFDKWQSFDFSGDENNLGVGSIKKWLKDDAPNDYAELQKNTNDIMNAGNVSTLVDSIDKEQKERESLCLTTDEIDKGARCVALKISEQLKKRLVHCDGWYAVTKLNLWNKVKKPSFLIVSEIHKFLDRSIFYKNQESFAVSEEEIELKKQLSAECMKLHKFYSTCDSSSYLSNITNHLSVIINDDDFADNLDKNIGYMAFTNGVVELKTMKFRKGICQDDYITRTIPFDYEVPEESSVHFVKDIIHKICNVNDEHTDYYLSILGYAFLGKAELEKAIYFFIGCGDNGKTLVLESLADICPCYVDELDRRTFEKNYAKAHKHLAASGGKRIMYIEELAKNARQNESWLKAIGDGKKMKNEVMHGTETKINVLWKLIVNSNHTPTFDVDGGIENRYKQVQFTSNFNKNNTEKKQTPAGWQFVQDKTLAGKLKGQYKMALLYLIMTYSQKYEENGMPKIPKLFLEEAQMTLSSNDSFKTWFEDNCIEDPTFKESKEDVVEQSEKPLKEVNDELKRLGYIYVKDLFFKGKKKGGWKGFRVKTNADKLKELEEEEEDKE